MESYLHKNTILKTIFLLTAVALLWFGTFGLIYHMDEMKQDGHIGGCLFSGQSEVCAMSFSEHVSFWRSAFTTMPPSNILLNLLILTIFSILMLAFRRDSLFEFFDLISSRFKLYIKQHFQITFFDSLKEAFSQGILNPKTY